MPTFTAFTTLMGKEPATVLGDAMERMLPEPTGVGVFEVEDGSGLWEIGGYFLENPDAAALAARRFSLTRVMAISLATLALVLLVYPMLLSKWQVILHAGVYGFCGGVFSVLFFTGFAKAFGDQHLGKIQGSAQLIAVVASALGPWWLAGRQEAIGSWFPSLSMLAPVFAVLAILAWLTKLPQR